MEKPKPFSMIREFHVADFFTLGNAACGVGAIFCAMVYVASPSLTHFLGIETANWLREIIYYTSDQRRLPAAGTTGEQNFFGHNARLWQCGQNHAVRPPILDDFNPRPHRGHLPPFPRCDSSHVLGMRFASAW